MPPLNRPLETDLLCSCQPFFKIHPTSLLISLINLSLPNFIIARDKEVLQYWPYIGQYISFEAVQKLLPIRWPIHNPFSASKNLLETNIEWIFRSIWLFINMQYTIIYCRTKSLTVLINFRNRSFLNPLRAIPILLAAFRCLENFWYAFDSTLNTENFSRGNFEIHERIFRPKWLTADDPRNPQIDQVKRMRIDFHRGGKSRHDPLHKLSF